MITRKVLNWGEIWSAILIIPREELRCTVNIHGQETFWRSKSYRYVWYLIHQTRDIYEDIVQDLKRDN